MQDSQPTNTIEEQIDILTAKLAATPEDPDLLYERGALYWRLGQRAAAVNDFSASAERQPDGRAARMLEYAREIEDFFNPDLYNP